MATGWQEADLGRVGRNVLEHPFCARWAAGELSACELADYASEYDHAVVAIAAAAARAADLDPRFAEAAAEELRQVSTWRAFARAVGWGGVAAWRYGEEPLPQTEECAWVWSGAGAETAAELLELLRAVDAIQAPLGEVMLNGLSRHYGFAEADAGTEYFSLHAALPGEAPSSRSAEVEDVYWKLLDGVEALGGAG
jgi:pyrroloquinoline quinone (PQQ) biosynthesis protein C